MGKAGSSHIIAILNNAKPNGMLQYDVHTSKMLVLILDPSFREGMPSIIIKFWDHCYYSRTMEGTGSQNSTPLFPPTPKAAGAEGGREGGNMPYKLAVSQHFRFLNILKGLEDP